MKAARILSLLGAITTLFGAFFALQGADLVRWPAESFMVGTRDWIAYGLVLALLGIGLMVAGRRLRG